MTVLVVSRVVPGLRGALTRWMIELHPGVFVGTMSARVRDGLWDKVRGMRRLGTCTMLHSANNEQGFVIHGDIKRRVTDFDGLQLVGKVPVRDFGLLDE